VIVHSLGGGFIHATRGKSVTENDRAALEIDPDRLDRDGETGIFVRAVLRRSDGDKLVSCDIVCLTRASLMCWLRSRGGDNPWAEECVALLLGHEFEEVAALLGTEDAPTAPSSP
jgi:hypothetical protein